MTGFRCTHELKTWPQYFTAVDSGEKTFEIRKDDRPYMVGDLLRLREYDPNTESYSGRECLREVTYVLRASEFVPPLYCAMSIQPLNRTA